MKHLIETDWIVSLTLPLLLASARDAEAHGPDIKSRCQKDELDGALADGRNAWARKCGLIEPEDYDFAVRRGFYWTFDGPGRAPWHADAPCSTNYKVFTMCPRGCFEENQTLLFDGKMLTPKDAHAAQIGFVTVLASGSAINRLQFVNEEIEFFVAGEEHKPLIKLSTASGKELVVTENHPVVDEAGKVISASDVRAGFTLLTTDGPENVATVESVPYDGMVWNVRPVSDSPLANIHVANGFLTGSLRYQNEWASEATRLHLRKHLDISGL